MSPSISRSGLPKQAVEPLFTLRESSKIQFRAIEVRTMPLTGAAVDRELLHVTSYDLKDSHTYRLLPLVSTNYTPPGAIRAR